MNMEYSCVQLHDLPDEILIIIFKKLVTAEVLYSVASVSEQFNRISHDSVFTNHLTLLSSTSNGCVYPLPNSILDRCCLHILPEIHQKIQWLDLESQSMTRILLATPYPNLYGISLYNIQTETAIGLFTDETSVICTLKNQISTLVIDISTNEIQRFPAIDNATIFTHIFTLFTNLQYLNFCPSLLGHQRLSFNITPLTIISRNLLKLHVYLDTFIDCLYLLDGRFNQLHTFYANISFILSSNLSINNKEKLPILKCFSLHCVRTTCVYDEFILPLLHRMVNLEKLDLCLIVDGRKTFVDGHDLKINIINHMSKLYKFTFNIRSSSRFYNEVNLPSNEYMQETFRDFKDKQIIHYVDYFPKQKEARCHIYSCPYKLNHYNGVTNNFPGGIFQCVRKVLLFDERPFEHEFFLQIQKSFPLMEELIVVNQQRQINKEFRKANNENGDLLSIIHYPYLKRLNLLDTCIDYHKQFLFDTKMCLPFHVRVYMNYKIVRKVTRNFRRNSTRNNCAKMNYVYLFREREYRGPLHEFFRPKIQFPEHIKDYFPHAEIK